MSAPPEHPPSPWRGIITAFLLLLAVLLLLGTGWALTSKVIGSRVNRSAGGMMFQARRIQSACLAYASVRGRLPVTLEDLVPDFLPDLRSLTDPEHPETGEVGYLYFGSGRTSLESPHEVLLASKASLRGRRAIILYGGQAALREFQPPLSTP